MYLASTWHGSGGNLTADIERMGLNIDYNSSFLRQEESQYLANPPEIARHFPTHIQKLCGYVCPTLQSERDEEPRIGLRHFICLFICTFLYQMGHFIILPIHEALDHVIH